MWVVDETAIVNNSDSDRRVQLIDNGFKLQINYAQVPNNPRYKTQISVKLKINKFMYDVIDFSCQMSAVTSVKQPMKLEPTRKFTNWMSSV